MKKPTARQWFIAQYGLHNDKQRINGMRDIVSEKFNEYLGEADLIIEIIFTAVKNDLDYINTHGFRYMCELLNIECIEWQSFFRRLHGIRR